MQEVDSERRLQILRGIPVEAPQAPAEEEAGEGRSRRDGSGRERKRRKIAGEDDTDRDIRFAQENSALVSAKAEMLLKSKRISDAPLTDRAGHINLFPVDGSRHTASAKNAEAEAEKAKKKKENEDQYTMRFSNAAGFKQAIGQTPWYHTLGGGAGGEAAAEVASKDVWGNEDPRRKEREKMRIAADDPLAAIQKGVSGLREVERERRNWKEEKVRETRELEEEERRQKKRRRRRHEDDLDEFSLDAPAKSESRHRRRDRSRGDEKDRYRSRRHHQRRGSPKPCNKPAWEVGPGGRYSSQFAQA